MQKGHHYPQIQEEWRFPDGERHHRLARQIAIEFSHRGGPAGSVDYWWQGYFRPDLVTKWLGCDYPIDDLRDSPYDFFFTVRYDATNDAANRTILFRVDRSDGQWEQTVWFWERDTFWPVSPNLPFSTRTTSPNWGLEYYSTGIGAVDWYDYPQASGWHLRKPALSRDASHRLRRISNASMSPADPRRRL